MKVASSDEEEQLTDPVLLDHLRELQQEVRELKDKSELDMQVTNNILQQEKHLNAANYELLQKDIRGLGDKIQRELEDVKAELQYDIAELQRQLHNQASSISSQTLAAQPNNNSSSATPPSRVTPSFFRRDVATRSHDGLPADTFTLMMTSPLRSQAWLLGIFTFAFQIALISMITSDQLHQAAASSDFNIPFKVGPSVSAGQFFTIIFALATQNDITDSIRLIVMFWNDPDWDQTLLQHEEEGSPPPTNAEWLVRIIVPNSIKLLQGILVMVITFVVIVQSDNIIDLFKDFTALMVLSETDNVFFLITINGYLGSKLQMNAIRAQSIKIQYETSESDTGSDPNHISTSASNKEFFIRPMILFTIAMVMIGFWVYVITNQIGGKYFYQRYQKCNMTDAFHLAKIHFGDEYCYGGPLNTLECEFEGGDCVNFNLAFPLCKGDDRIDVQNSVGNGICQEMFITSDCDYDGGDCCPYEIFHNPLFGDGQCNGGKACTAGCDYDNGDCSEFRFAYPDCPFDIFSQIDGADNIKIGDGMCDSGIYNTAKCGYEFGDCNHGQLGQTVSISEEVMNFAGVLFFSQSLSLDGTTMALGLYWTDDDGTTSNDLFTFATGLVKIWRFDNIKKMWLQLGNNFVGSQQDGIGYVTSFSADGSRVMVSSASGVRVYGFIASRDIWSQVGQTINSSLEYSAGIMTADGSRVALIYSEDEIRIYDVKSSEYNVIKPRVYLHCYDDKLKFNSLDGSRLLLSTVIVTKIFQLDPDATSRPWIQIGQDFNYDVPKDVLVPPSTAISAGGNRIAISFNSTLDAPGQVNVLDYSSESKQWVLLGEPIKSRSSSNGDGFGYVVEMSSDGDLLVIASSPKCQVGINGFNIINCIPGSVELYSYNHNSNQFQKVPPIPASPYRGGHIFNPSYGNVFNLADISDTTTRVFGLHFSLSGDGTVLLISGYNIENGNTLVEAYDLDQLFYTKCIVGHPNSIGNGFCDEEYNTEECGFDGGDCL